MCNDTLELLRIKDENIKYINQEIDVIIKGKKATVVNAVLTYKPSACYCCGVKNEGQIHKHGKRVSRITLLKTQGYNTYLNLAKQRFKCLECNGTFTAKTSIVDESCLILYFSCLRFSNFNIGLRAAVASSNRSITVVCGASSTLSGSFLASSAILINVSIK